MWKDLDNNIFYLIHDHGSKHEIKIIYFTSITIHFVNNYVQNHYKNWVFHKKENLNIPKS
jgi:hypothetical protein